MDEEQRFSEEKDPEDIGIAHLSNEEIEILMENGFKESIYLLRTQHQAAMAALRSIKMEKSQSMKSDSKESHRPLDGGNQVPRKQRELSDEHQSFPIGPISDRYREAIEKAKISQKLDLNSEESFPELKDHQPLDGGPGKDDGGVAKEKGVKFAGETTYYFERGQTSGTKQDHGSEAAAGKEAGKVPNINVNVNTPSACGNAPKGAVPGWGNSNVRAAPTGQNVFRNPRMQSAPKNYASKAPSSAEPDNGNRGSVRESGFERGRNIRRESGEGIRERSSSGERRTQNPWQYQGRDGNQNVRGGRGGRFGRGRGYQNNFGGRGSGVEDQSGRRVQSVLRKEKGKQNQMEGESSGGEKDSENEEEKLRRVSEESKEKEKEKDIELERQKTAGKMAKDLPEKQNLEGDESSGDEGKATAVIGGAYGGREGSKETCEGSEGERNQKTVEVEMDKEKAYKELHVSPPRTRARTQENVPVQPKATGVNWAVGRDGLKCGFFARNSRGGFCVAGVYLLHDGGSMGDLVKSMLRDCWSWCWRKRTRKMILESSDWQRVDVGDLSRFSEEVQVVVNQCTERVNCVADCFVNASANVNIAYIKKDALPRGIGRVLALEGVPHFVFVPGLDFA
nr:uncharacterized protein LOC109147873 [Ipomoea batatas]